MPTSRKFMSSISAPTIFTSFGFCDLVKRRWCVSFYVHEPQFRSICAFYHDNLSHLAIDASLYMKLYNESLRHYQQNMRSQTTIEQYPMMQFSMYMTQHRSYQLFHREITQFSHAVLFLFVLQQKVRKGHYLIL